MTGAAAWLTLRGHAEPDGTHHTEHPPRHAAPRPPRGYAIFRHGSRLVTGENGELISQIDLFPTLLELAGVEPGGHNANTPARSFVPALRGQPYERSGAVYLEQEETRAVRTGRRLYKRRFRKAPAPPYPDEMYDLTADPEEKTDLAADPAYADTARELIARIDSFFGRYADPRYDLRHGGAPQSNSDKPWLWKEARGDQRESGFQGPQ